MPGTDDLPHILILMPDQFRADCLGCAEHPQIKTPSLDALASEGMRFTNAFTVAPLCMPARASFVSGLYPHNHGMWSNAGRLPPTDETFFHHLKAAGYFTAYFGKSHFYEHAGDLRMHEDYMHARGIDHVHETTGPWATCRTESYMTRHWAEVGLLEAFRQDYEKRRVNGPCSVWPSPLPSEEFMDSYVGRQAVEWIGAHEGDQPVCMFVGFGGPHEPWDAPGDYATMYEPSETPKAIPSEPVPEWVPGKAAERITSRRIAGMTDDEVARIRANYYGKISLVDHWVGRILDAFKQRGWLDDTLVVFWSDHGEMAGDHGLLHKSIFFRSAAQVPLIVRWPDRLPADVQCGSLVEIIDVFPTLLEAAGCPPSQRCLGKSLLHLAEDPSAVHRDAVLSEVGDSTMLRTRDHLYAVDREGSGFMLHDLNEDPEERRNLIGHEDSAQAEAALRDRLLRLIASTRVRQHRGAEWGL